MRKSIEVVLGDTSGRLVGVLRHGVHGAREHASFEYVGEWRSNGFQVDPTLPLVQGPQFRKRVGEESVFHGVIADTEPDGWGRRVIRRDHAKRRQRAKERGEEFDSRRLNDLDYLLAVDDATRAGALRFRDETGTFQRGTVPGQRTAPPLVELAALHAASRAVELHSETDADLAYLRGRATSLGGLRPKCSVVDERGELSIGKFPSVEDERAVTKGEVLALRLATRAGIRAAEARLIDSDGIPVALVKRFDRSPGGGRLMYASAATLLGVEPGAERTYTDLVDAIRVHGADVQSDLEELFRRIAFSIAITNTDDHLRNHGFLHVEHGKWRLSPAFDLNPFPGRERELKTWISEETGPRASGKALLETAPYFRISKGRAREIVADVERVVVRWREVGAALGMRHSELDAFEEAFEHDALRT